MQNVTKKLIERTASDLVTSKYAVALTGAGMSTESKIPDFRGPSGIWTKDPKAEKKAYQSYQKFLMNPKEYWKERLNTPSMLGNLEEKWPNAGHHALAELEKVSAETPIYKSVGSLLVRADDKEGVEKELSEKKETTDVRLKALDRQEKQLIEKYQALQQELTAAISASKQEQST